MNSYVGLNFMMYPCDVIRTMHVLHVVMVLFNEFPVVFNMKILACMERIVSTISDHLVMLCCGNELLCLYVIV